MRDPIINARFTRLNRDCQNKSIKRSWRGKEYYNKHHELAFLKALRSGEVARLLNSLYNDDLVMAELSFDELKNLWGWQRDYTFLIPHLTPGTGESGFIATLGVNILAIVERDLITRCEYIEAYLDKDSQRIVQEFKKQCNNLQEKNDTKTLFNEVKQEAFHRVLKNGKQTNLVDNICLAIAEKALLDPINTVLGRIKHAPSLEDAQHELKNLERQLLQYAQERNITSMQELKAQTVEQYGFDLLHASHEMYRARHDYINTPEHQSILSDHLATILGNIKYNDLPSAHSELIAVEKQIKDALEIRGITDPIEQKERIIKDLGADVIAVIRSTYQERADFRHLLNNFKPIDVASSSVRILDTNNSYESVFNEFQEVTNHVLHNAKLCDLECLPRVEDHLFDSLQVMRAPKNNIEFIFHTTVVDHLLTDLQSQATAIVEGKPIEWQQRSQELFTRASVKFIERLNPIEQIKDMGSLLYHLGYFAGKGLSATAYVAIHPLEIADNIAFAREKICEVIIDTARFTCNTMSGLYYLSPEERSRRLESYWQGTGQICHHLKSYITAENIIDIVAPFAADIIFTGGISALGAYLKEINAASKLSHEIRIIAQGLKRAVEDEPAFAAVEGMVLKMSDSVHTMGNQVVKEIVNTTKNLLESIYSSISIELKAEIEAIRGTIKLPNGFAESGHKPIKIAYEHILGMEINVNKKGKLVLSGFHHDYKNLIQKSDLIKFENLVINKYGCYQTDLIIDGLRIPNKSFFPAEWSRKKVADKIHEAYDHFKKSNIIPQLERDGKYKIRGFTKEGIEIEMCFTVNGEMKTAYPIVQSGN